LQSGKVCSGKLERIFPSINFSSKFSRIHAKEKKKQKKSKELKNRLTTFENSIVDFSSFGFPADFQQKTPMKNDALANQVLQTKSIDGQKRPLGPKKLSRTGGLEPT